MSYNVSGQKSDKYNNFKIPIKSIYKDIERNDWKPEQPKFINVEKNHVQINFGCEQYIKGYIKDQVLEVEEINLIGEGSGAAMYYWFNNAFKDSTGTFETVLIWEGGDSINRLKIENGVFTETPIEL